MTGEGEAEGGVNTHCIYVKFGGNWTMSLFFFSFSVSLSLKREKQK